MNTQLSNNCYKRENIMHCEARVDTSTWYESEGPMARLSLARGTSAIVELCQASSQSPVETETELSWATSFLLLLHCIARRERGGERERESYEIEIVVEGEKQSILVRHFPYCFVNVWRHNLSRKPPSLTITLLTLTIRRSSVRVHSTIPLWR